jgi:F-type H+-transporting ATPase subunit c
MERPIPDRNDLHLHRGPDHRRRLGRPGARRGAAVAQALASIAQQPDSAGTITRTLFVGLAMVESTAIYCFVVALILIYANPFWDQVLARAGG